MSQLAEHPSVKRFYEERKNRGEVPMYQVRDAACPPVPFERLRLSRISWAPSGSYFLKKCSQLLAISEMFPSLCNFASANNPSP